MRSTVFTNLQLHNNECRYESSQALRNPPDYNY